MIEHVNNSDNNKFNHVEKKQQETEKNQQSINSILKYANTDGDQKISVDEQITFFAATLGYAKKTVQKALSQFPIGLRDIEINDNNAEESFKNAMSSINDKLMAVYPELKDINDAILRSNDKEHIDKLKSIRRQYGV